MRKILFIVTSFIVVFLVILFFAILSQKPKKESVTQTPLSPTNIPSPTPIPESETINISGVEVSNFYKKATKIGKSSEVYLANKNPARYQLLYVGQFNQFLISIVSFPFNEIRIEAEQDLLAQLGISEEQACLLNISITTPSFANPEFAGKIYKPSFCE